MKIEIEIVGQNEIVHNTEIYILGFFSLPIFSIYQSSTFLTKDSNDFFKF